MRSRQALGDTPDDLGVWAFLPLLPATFTGVIPKVCGGLGKRHPPGVVFVKPAGRNDKRSGIANHTQEVSTSHQTFESCGP